MTLSNPLISVIMTTYNHELYVGEAIESVLSQTYENIELIIVNDGSTDRTDDIIKKFDDKRITYIYQKNQGTSSATNKAILASKGKYIALMSGDDICYTSKLEKQYNYLSNFDIRVVFSWVDFINESSQLIDCPHFLEQLFNHPNRARHEILRYLFFRGNYINAVTGLISKELLLETGLFNLASIQLQDFEMWLKLIKRDEIYILPEPLVKYRVITQGKNLSNPSNSIRSDFEYQQIYRSIFDDVPKEFFKAAFADIIRNPQFSNRIDYELEKAFLYLQHNSSYVQIIGCEKLFKLFQDPDIVVQSTSKYNFSLVDLYKLTNQIDFLNKKSSIENQEILKQQEKELVKYNLIINHFDYEIKRNLNFLSANTHSLKYKPIFSIIFPVYNTPSTYLRDAIESVLDQIYPYWELCIADDASTEAHVRKILGEYAQKDSRIKVVFRDKNGHISRTSNSAIEIATGEFIALFDHDDLLTSDALYEVALLLNQHPDADMIYSDEDKVNDHNQFLYPTYKPDWCPDSFFSRMYTCHLGVYRRSLVNKIGGFRVGYEGSQDYDLVLRFTEETKKIFHIPKVLYHWRLHAGSTSASTTAKSYAYEAAIKALTDALQRRGEKGVVLQDANIPGHYHVRYEIEDYKLVSIIILTQDFCSNLNQCLESIFAETLYPNYEVIVIQTGNITSTTEESIQHWQVQQPGKFKHYLHQIPFNYSVLNNYAVKKSQGDYLLFLNNDTQIIQGDWLNAMVEQVQRESIGAVGTLLTYPNNSIQHVGSVLGLGKIANHIYKGLTRIAEDHAVTNILLINNISIVTGACLMCRREVFDTISGFDEALPIHYNDVDLCLKIKSHGYHNIYIPHVRLIHQELKSWQEQISQEELLQLEAAAFKLMQDRWGIKLNSDPCFSPHLIRHLNFQIQSENQESTQFIHEGKENKEQALSQPLVSICIPTYNGEKFIAEAINSVLSQTYPSLEIILSDDSSTDKTVDIAKSLLQKSSVKFSILEHSQYGLANNWNFCISQAQGKYIKFLFQDDLLEPNAVALMVNIAEKDKEIGLVFSPRKIFTNTGDTIYDSNFLREHEAKDVHKAWSKLQPIQLGQELLQSPNIFDAPINKVGEPSTVLIRKEIFDSLGLFNSEFCQLVDLEMWLRIMSQYKIGFVDKYLSKFRIHSQQQTRRNASVEKAIFSDYQKLFHAIYNDQRYPQVTRQLAFYQNAVLSQQDSDLRQSRRQLADQWLNITPEQMPIMYAGILGETHKVLVNSSIKYKSLTDEEQIFVDSLIQHIEAGFEQPKAIQYLLAVMLYQRADRLRLPYDLSDIPHWLVKDYVQFLFASPVHFQEIGEANNYYNYMQGWLDYLHTSISQEPDSIVLHTAVNYFAQIANFIPLYFNEANLKDIYVKRADILEFFLKNKGHEVDYEFTEIPVNRKKIRLGILASHFTPGSETFAYLPVYEYLSREFEVILYSLTKTGHSLEQYCQSCANFFKRLPQDLTQQVNTIRADDLDILFIATNVTAVTNQICLLAMHRLARIQVTSGGSVVTTGIRHIDYYISGTLTDPSATAQEQYREKLLKLEGTAHCFSYGTEQEQVNVEVTRKKLGIAEDTVAFISGANFYKMIPELINTWAKIIVEVPNSVLVLLPYGPNWSNSYPKESFENYLINVFEEYGISADRLIVLAPQPVPNREEVKEYLKIADVYLDSYPFAGTTSLIEPLQVNLPVIARQGNSFRSAMGAAMIRSMKISDLVADSEESYIKLAIALGNDPELRHNKRQQIQEKMQANPSFLDSRSYSAKIESLFKQVFNNYLVETLSQNLPLRDINLIIFPDWTQSEESIGLELERVIKALANYPDSEKTTLLIDTNNIAVEDAEIFLSSVAMNLLMNEDLDITEGLEISLVDKLGDNQWQALLLSLTGRIVLENENKPAITHLPIQEIYTWELEKLTSSTLEIEPV
ncbi:MULTISPECIES: glycosyltransferase [Calothrix]|uniref:Glycosyltransferase n=2 Tax=Calothrix TaxID=1186 RepID=A0ABR8AC89_9CYAN|nr:MULTISPECIES: glycosyltransferase [Calothrix]MBD2197616.1 glycosyltransferase [Calothrix parietina FACHB-288]MBD2227428.1 glycosyltransferase [Calothrix anomala FACHB-343]